MIDALFKQRPVNLYESDCGAQCLKLLRVVEQLSRKLKITTFERSL